MLTHIDRYEVKTEMGSGGMASVFRAYDPHFKRDVAIKVLRQTYLASEDLRQRFEQEAYIIASLEHYAIVPVYDFGTFENNPYIVMRLMTGGSLEARLTADPLEMTQIDLVLRRICSALDKAHANHVIHRDLKPANILFDEDGMPYLADFGIARLTAGTQTKTMSGTPSYMAPEQIQNQPLAPPTDVYQMGVIFFQMLTGALPYQADNTMALMYKHVNEPIPSLVAFKPDVAPKFQEIVHQALAKEPADRPQTAGALYKLFAEQNSRPYISPTGQPRPFETFDTVVDPTTPPVPASPPPAPSPSASSPSASPPRSRTWLWLLGGAIILALILGLGGAIFSNLTAGAPTAETPADAPTAVPIVVVITSEAGEVVQTEVTATPIVVTATPQPGGIAGNPDPATPTATATASPAPQIETNTIGASVTGQPITAVQLGDGERAIIFVGGVHAGFVPASVTVMENMLTYFSDNMDEIPANVTLYLIPSANPDSPEAPGDVAGRLNANGVDLNRNWDCNWSPEAVWRNEPVGAGSEPFSEPEVAALRDFILSTEPVGVFFWHGRATGGLVSPGGCLTISEHSIPMAEAFATAANYGTANFDNIANYEVNGDSVNWLDAQGIPAVSVLLPDYDDPDFARNLRGAKAVLTLAAGEE